MSANTGNIRGLWFKWKSLRLPWRKRVLAGQDLAGNTYWEFKDVLNAGRWRRIVNYNLAQRTAYSEVKLAPQWIQWLRHTRPEPPSIEEQQDDIVRQARMKQLAAAADARWASQPSYLDPPSKTQPIPGLAFGDSGRPTGRNADNMDGAQDQEQQNSTVDGQTQPRVYGKPNQRFEEFEKEEVKANPWKSGKKETAGQEPAPWTPKTARR
ncbi:hypothetical protein K402DRAFT_416224 [Aulographum hederae CBS 113979]|uniref:Uncharacterized protein n=1 Tax=Aulographum hederae CBS 113979 TaxID=1176131 RepID=A0A6G1HHM7_9PEZI|nr:hypothetical protein K402DRAFT_416224 [Aulographum hederae CBS 113979]